MGESFSPQKKTSSTFIFVGNACPPGSGSGSSRPKSVRTYADPDPQPCFKGNNSFPSLIYYELRRKDDLWTIAAVEQQSNKKKMRQTF
jgi:hypothetical protein